MRYFKIALFLAAIFAILATLFIRAEGSYAAALASCGAWRIVKSPNSSFGVESLFNGVAVVSSNDAWAVGTSRNQSGFSSHTLTEHWNGSQWSIISSANPSSAQNVLVSAAALTTNNVWSVGETGNSDGTAFQTLVEHWNGTRWNVIPSLNTSLSFNYLSSVAIVSAKDIWAVGVAMAAGDVSSQTLIEHWNGSQWSIVASPNPGSPFNNLRSVTAVSEYLGGRLYNRHEWLFTDVVRALERHNLATRCQPKSRPDDQWPIKSIRRLCKQYLGSRNTKCRIEDTNSALEWDTMASRG